MKTPGLWGILGRMVLVFTLLAAGRPLAAADDEPWLELKGTSGPGQGKHIVFLAADDEYRSEELIPQFAKIAALHHGFRCTVLFAINKQTGQIDPATLDNIPGLDKLTQADLLVMLLRFRELPDEQMKYIIDYTHSGRPIMGLRTSTHPFNYSKHPAGPYARYSYRSQDPPGGYGRLVFGETWISHYGRHQQESTRGVIVPDRQLDPIVRGVEGIWGPSDVYGLTSLQGDCRPLVLGQVLSGMQPDDPPAAGKKLVPVAWTKTFTGPPGKTARVFFTTMGHAHDFKNEGFRRLCINACYWCLGMEQDIPPRSNVELVGQYDPAPIGMNGFKKGVRPADHRLPEPAAPK
ncbi:MAG: ThuA domain-containing protein [Sedimentisphaerales bacterium]|nr:ThuA domain-containing protein [Sedimentisphaerales bacterium]